MTKKSYVKVAKFLIFTFFTSNFFMFTSIQTVQKSPVYFMHTRYGDALTL